MEETPKPQTSVQTTKRFPKNLRSPILLIISPVLSLALALLASTLLSQMYNTPASPLIGYFHMLIIIVAILSLLAIPPCLIIGSILLFKRIRSHKLTTNQGHLETPTPPTAPQPIRTTQTAVMSVALVILWLLIPFGFLILLAADGFARAMDGSGCIQNPSAGHCQPTYIGTYFAVYMIVIFISTIVIVAKKLK